MSEAATVVLAGVFALAIGATVTSDRALRNWLVAVAPTAPTWAPHAVLLTEIGLLWGLIAAPREIAPWCAAWLVGAAVVIAYAIRRVGGCPCFGTSSLASHPIRSVLRNVLLAALAMQVATGADITTSVQLTCAAVAMLAALAGSSRVIAGA